MVYESSVHIHPEEETDSLGVKKQAVSESALTAGSAFISTFIIQVIAITATFFLTLFLTPKEYGVYILLLAVVSFLTYFSDIGLSAALIQKKEDIVESELRTTFTAQQLFTLFLVGFVFLITPILDHYFKFNKETAYLLWALLFSLAMSSLKNVPTLLLERELKFQKITFVQMTELAIFNIIAVYLAWRGFGIASFTYAIFAKSISGVVLTYIFHPWFPIPSFSKDTFGHFLKLGMPYEVNAFLTVLKEDGIIVALSAILGIGGIGLLGWAQAWTVKPLRIFMENILQNTLSTFSRLQDNAEDLSEAVSETIFSISSLVFPFLAALFFLAPMFVSIIPDYGKWRPALTALFLYIASSAVSVIIIPLTSVLSAVGKISITAKSTLVLTLLSWILIPILAYKYGVTGAALGSLLVAFASAFFIFLVVKYVNFNWFRSIAVPAIATFFMSVIVYFGYNLEAFSFYWIAGLSFIALFGYFIVLIILH